MGIIIIIIIIRGDSRKPCISLLDFFFAFVTIELT